jgi:hypothetical protein
MEKIMNNPIVIIPCGAKKLNRPAKAINMYQGSYYKKCRDYALSLTMKENIFILSAKYGLLPLDKIIEPYSLTLGQEGCVNSNDVRKQAGELNLLDRDCIAIGGKRYTNLCKRVWKEAKTPLEGKGGMGYQMKWMKEQIDIRKL